MLARIEQVTTTPEGALALFATYWQDGQQVNAQRHALMMPVRVLSPYRNGDGLLAIRIARANWWLNRPADPELQAAHDAAHCRVIQWNPASDEAVTYAN